MYHYAGNNPVRFVDPTGAFNWDTNTIEAGDTLTKITNKFNQIYETNYSVDEVAQACGIANKDYIREGDKLDFSKILPEWHISARGSGIGAWVGALFLFAGVQADLSGYTMNFVITETGERFSGKYYSLSKDGQALKIGCGIYTIDIEAHAVFKGVKPTPQQVKKSFEGSSKNIGVSVIFAGISGSENDLWLVNSGTLSYSTGLPFSVGFENSETWLRGK